MIHDIYSKRQKRLRGEFTDVYQYEHIPNELRNQIIFILEDFGSSVYSSIFREVHKILYHEYGQKLLNCRREQMRPDEDLRVFFSETNETDRVIDVIELSFGYIEQWKEAIINKIEKQFVEAERAMGSNISNISFDRIIKVADGIDPSWDEIFDSFIFSAGAGDIAYSSWREGIENVRKFKKKVNGAIEELNIRFREHGVGYQYESGQIIKVNSQYVHSEAVHPVLNLLSDPMYRGANTEFLKAHDHYRKSDYESCISECCKAFESVLKIICNHRGWGYNPKDTAKPLLEIVYKNGLLPKHTKSFFNGVRSGLEHGVPVIRNQYAAHGQGNQKESVPDYMVENMLHLTASSILLLVKANKTIA